jgi:Bacterial regulatory protein, Fis family
MISLLSPSHACAPLARSARRQNRDRRFPCPPRRHRLRRRPFPFSLAQRRRVELFPLPLGRRAHSLRLFEGELACSGCLKARGCRARIELIPTPARAAHTGPRRIARLAGPPARLHPRRGPLLDRRTHIEAALRHSQIVARQHALDEHAHPRRADEEPGQVSLPATVADLDLPLVAEALARHSGNVTDAAAELRVPPSDLRRLLWANSSLQDQAFETVEARLDTAEKNIHEALASEDSRRRDAASFFVLRNTARAKRRGWITSASASVDVNVQNNKTVNYTFRWQNADDPDPGVDETGRLRDEGKTVVSIGWSDPNEKIIEAEAVSADK